MSVSSWQSLHPMSGISVYDINKDRLALFESKFGTKSHSDIETAVADAELVILAIKPQNVTTVSKALRGNTRPAAVLLSIVAGVGIDEFAESTGVRKIVRTMPNTVSGGVEGDTPAAAMRLLRDGRREACGIISTPARVCAVVCSRRPSRKG
jgi:pyrroline-5-carboxylate reductase